MAYNTLGLNLLTPGQLQNNEDETHLKQATVQPLTTSFGSFVTPQFLAAPQQYFAFNSAFFNAPFGQYAYTTGQQYLPQFVATLPSVTQRALTSGTPITSKIPTTRRPFVKEREPTTRKPQGLLKIKPPKLQLKPEENSVLRGDFKSDKALLKAVGKINPEYVIEEIISVPGHHVLSMKTTEKLKSQPKPLDVKQLKKPLSLKKISSKISQTNESGVKVEATGKTSTKGNIPEIPFVTYFLPYFSQDQLQEQKQQKPAKKPAALILEPHSKAIVGNGGTAISTPISRAYLKRGVTTNVYFNPESVAIAGVGGKAHAQADLELDLIS